MDDIGTSLESLDLNQIKQTIPPEPKVPVKRLFNRIDHFFRHTKFKPNIPEPVIKDSLTKLALMRKIKQEYLQKIAKLKEERQAMLKRKQHIPSVSVLKKRLRFKSLLLLKMRMFWISKPMTIKLMKWNWH